MSNVILLEDEPILCDELAEYLTNNGHRVDATRNVAEFMRILNPRVHKVAVLDLGLPDGDGMDVVRRLRKEAVRMGIVILTARGGTQPKLDGLLGGADYFLPKTAELGELTATIAALERRLGIQAQPRWLLQAGRRQITPPGCAPVGLSAQDYMVLKVLALGGECVTRLAIVQALGADFLDYDQRRLDTQMSRLRRKIHEASGLELPVNTLRAVGFSFSAPIDVQD